jgi:hypothetical protein
MGLRPSVAVHVLVVFVGVSLVMAPSVLVVTARAAAAESALTVELTDVRVTSTDITGSARPIELRIRVANAEGPVAWAVSFHSLKPAGFDVGFSISSDADPYAQVLSNGWNRLRVTDTATYGTSGEHEVILQVSDTVSGELSEASGRLVIKGLGKVTIGGVHARRGSVPIVWGRFGAHQEGATVDVYYRASGSRAFRRIGTVEAQPNGYWYLKSRKLSTGRIYARISGAYLKAAKSKTYVATAGKYAKKLPNIYETVL